MSLYAVVRQAGPGWVEGRGAFEQPGVDRHAAFMDRLAAEGFVLFAGPLAGSELDRIRALVIVDADDEGQWPEILDREEPGSECFTPVNLRAPDGSPLSDDSPLFDTIVFKIVCTGGTPGTP